MSTKISVVTASFNQASYLEATLQSVLRQDGVELEYIVVDGGSKDRSKEIIKRYEGGLAYWVSEPDGGHYDAVNKGMAASTGEIQCFLNSDDMFFPGALKAVVSIFDAFPEIDWISSLQPAAWDNVGVCHGVGNIPGYSRCAFLDGLYGGARNQPYFIQQESTFWRRSLWDRVGGIRTEVTYAGDFDLWARFYEHAELVGVQALLGGFRIREGQRVGHGDIYATQCRSQLDFARKKAAYMGRFSLSRRFRGIIRRSGVSRRPKIGKLLAPLGYNGKRIERVAPGAPKPTWKLIDAAFF